jgi:hypothetical protein
MDEHIEVLQNRCEELGRNIQRTEKEVLIGFEVELAQHVFLGSVCQYASMPVWSMGILVFISNLCDVYHLYQTNHPAELYNLETQRVNIDSLCQAKQQAAQSGSSVSPSDISQVKSDQKSMAGSLEALQLSVRVLEQQQQQRQPMSPANQTPSPQVQSLLSSVETLQQSVRKLEQNQPANSDLSEEVLQMKSTVESVQKSVRVLEQQKETPSPQVQSLLSSVQTLEQSVRKLEQDEPANSDLNEEVLQIKSTVESIQKSVRLLEQQKETLSSTRSETEMQLLSSLKLVHESIAKLEDQQQQLRASLPASDLFDQELKQITSNLELLRESLRAVEQRQAAAAVAVADADADASDSNFVEKLRPIELSLETQQTRIDDLSSQANEQKSQFTEFEEKTATAIKDFSEKLKALLQLNSQQNPAFLVSGSKPAAQDDWDTVVLFFI